MSFESFYQIIKIIDRSKLKAFADDNLNVTKMNGFVFGRVENIVGNGENAGYQHFLHFQQRFHTFFSSAKFSNNVFI